MVKPKLKSSQKIIDLPEDMKPALSNNSINSFVEYETVGWGYILKDWGKKIALFFLFAVILAVAAYAALAATIAYTVKIDGTLYSVARGTYVGNEIPEGEVVYASYDQPAVGDFMSNLTQGARSVIGEDPVSQPVVVEVVAGPIAKVQVNGEQITFNPGDKDENALTADVDGLDNKTKLLDGQYVVECKWGACEVGSYFVLPAENVSGEIIKLGSK